MQVFWHSVRRRSFRVDIIAYNNNAMQESKIAKVEKEQKKLPIYNELFMVKEFVETAKQLTFGNKKAIFIIGQLAVVNQQHTAPSSNQSVGWW